MPLEGASYIHELVETNPVDTTDQVASLGAHTRLIKLAAKNTFPNVLGAVTASHTEMNYLVGVTAPIQAQLDSRAAASHTHAAADITSGVLGLARGGTGESSAAAAAQAFLNAVGGTPGNILFRGASGWSVLPPGTAGQLLRMNSGATAPEWANININTSGGPLRVFIATTPGTHTATRPFGATIALIKVQGGGGAGVSLYEPPVVYHGGGGGYAEAIKAVSSNLTVTIGTSPKNASVTNGVWTVQGNAGGDAVLPHHGSGGTASGGDVNIPGHGRLAVLPYGSGGIGIPYDYSPHFGGPGIVIIYWF